MLHACFFASIDGPFDEGHHFTPFRHANTARYPGVGCRAMGDLRKVESIGLPDVRAGFFKIIQALVCYGLWWKQTGMASDNFDAPFADDPWPSPLHAPAEYCCCCSDELPRIEKLCSDNLIFGVILPVVQQGLDDICAPVVRSLA